MRSLSHSATAVSTVASRSASHPAWSWPVSKGGGALGKRRVFGDRGIGGWQKSEITIYMHMYITILV